MDLKGRDFLKLLDFTPEEIGYLIDLAADLKAKKKAGIPHRYCEGKNIALIFEKTSTRTRCSFEVAAHDLGMGCTYLNPDAFGAEVDLLIEVPFPVLRHGGDPRDGEREDDGHDVKAHLTLDGADVLKEDADAEVQHQEDQDGQERLAVGLWFVGRIGFHKTSSE